MAKKTVRLKETETKALSEQAIVDRYLAWCEKNVPPRKPHYRSEPNNQQNGAGK